MPPQAKGTTKASSDTKVREPATVAERTQQRFDVTNPLVRRARTDGFASLTDAEKKTLAHSQLVLPVAQQRLPLSNRSEREFWKTVAREGLPIRRLRDDYSWGTDRSGGDIAGYSPPEHAARLLSHARLTALNLLSARFSSRRRLATEHNDEDGEENKDTVTAEEIAEEKNRRREMAGLKKELYGYITGTLANDPEWDDVIPILHEEPENALARIAYPNEYAEAVAYLRAIMAADEHSPRALRLTALVIDLNPAHYTVWLYRFEIVRALDLPVPDEISWLNGVALESLKNYQIWHHRQLLLQHLAPRLSPEGTRDLARTESAFLATMLAQDAKNYHVWSYRQFMVRQLGHWGPQELAATQSLIEDDVRNNSAWSHRFFLVFSSPDASTAAGGSSDGDNNACGPTTHDAAVPAETIDREVRYAKEKIALAPQNQSAWNYLRAALAKGGRPLETEVAVVDADGLVSGLGTASESVRSSHALDFLADVYAARGDSAGAKLCLQRLWEKWDPVREGYWRYRASQLA